MQRERWKAFQPQASIASRDSGVSHAAFAGVPLTGNKWPGRDEIPGRPGRQLADRITLPLRAITQDYFPVMSMALVDGRAFRETDDEAAPRVAIVNGHGRRYFANANPIGRQMQFAGTPLIRSRSSASSPIPEPPP